MLVFWSYTPSTLLYCAYIFRRSYNSAFISLCIPHTEIDFYGNGQHDVCEFCDEAGRRPVKIYGNRHNYTGGELARIWLLYLNAHKAHPTTPPLHSITLHWRRRLIHMENCIQTNDRPGGYLQSGQNGAHFLTMQKARRERGEHCTYALTEKPTRRRRPLSSQTAPSA